MAAWPGLPPSELDACPARCRRTGRAGARGMAPRALPATARETAARGRRARPPTGADASAATLLDDGEVPTAKA